MGINQIRLVHPSGTPVHHHDEEKQTVMLSEGELDVVIGTETVRMKPGDVCLIPAKTEHCFETVGVDALLIEVFAPMRLQNLVWFLGKNF
jgi:mannose-6-phosphate isomerase-like protein (cupin superfamily)